MPVRISKLRLLSEQTKTSIEERNRLLVLKVPISSHDDREILKSLKTIRHGLQEIDSEIASSATKYDKSQFNKLITNYNSLLSLYKEDDAVAESFDDNEYAFAPQTTSNNNAPSTPLQSSLASSSSSPNKSVRFKDNIIDTERFIQPYKDFPDESELPDRPDRPVESSGDLYEQQQQLLSDQDIHLDALAQSVARQHQLSIQIDSELDSHLELLDDVDELTDRTQDRLHYARKRLDVFSHKARQHGSAITITILILILVILLIVLS